MAGIEGDDYDSFHQDVIVSKLYLDKYSREYLQTLPSYIPSRLRILELIDEANPISRIEF